MMSSPHTVACFFHVRVDAINEMKQLIADVTKPSRVEHGCLVYHWSQSLEDDALFLLYMEWEDRAAFEAHVATTHVQRAERDLVDLCVQPYHDWQFVRL